MAVSPRWKVGNKSGEYVASCKHVEDAAALVALYGDGATIRDGWTRSRRVVWREGSESTPAGESYDVVATVVWGRVESGETAPRAAVER